MYYINVENNVKLAVEDLTYTKCSHTLLFVHGWPLSRKIFEYQCNILPLNGVRCVTYDMRGYGNSDKCFRGYDYNRMAEDLNRIIQSINCKKIILLGFSMGGAIAVRCMARFKNPKVCRLILCGAACPSFARSAVNPYGMPVEQINNLIAQTYKDRPLMCDNFSQMCFATNVSNSFRRWFSNIAYEAGGRASIRGLECLRDEDLSLDLRTICVPTMILHGRKDIVCPFQFAEQMDSLIEDSFIIPFENSGHCLFYDEIDKFNQCVASFVKS